MYSVVIPIHVNGRQLEPGDAVPGETFGIYLPDLLALGALEAITEQPPAPVTEEEEP